MGILDVLNASKIKKENEKLQSLITQMGAGDAIAIQRKIDELAKDKDSLIANNEQLKKEQENLTSSIDEKKSQIIVLEEELMLEDFALYKPKFNFTSSDEYKKRLEIIRDKQKQLIKSGIAANGNQNWTVNNNRTQGKKMVNDMIKLVLRSFNNECDYCVDNVKFNNIERSVKRIEQSYESLNKIGAIMQVSISYDYKDCKLEELYLAYEYQQKKQEEREEQKKIREELREQQKLEQEIKEAREKIAKEKKHFSTALKGLEERYKNVIDEVEKKIIQERMREIREQLGELEKEEKVIDYREQNAKAGYVYIISNIGAFGEGVYKIGMTRRLEPTDRIDELGDASVPFTFDIHAMIFSDNAPELEAKIHQHFYNNRINKLNNRKEFFRADINEIEKVVKENYDKVIDMVKNAPAEQYRESLLIK
ncbi:MAG TPA: DUF4041 domain-containing protein [Candidatus Moranbacteria bacterium]|nr:DUF4041 domain-containing protein [Candidatus Moranbacteria bacterium]HRY28285.1 DUF4041 domain-containing protein [Candidatus Moranbacteria bacterium]HSA08057.1 DUF4041 domain-containing protein [Candidatus Moranbacteria bacterium]